AVFFAKKRKCQIEVLNDINENIYTFFKVLRNQNEEFKAYIENIPYSHQIHKEYLGKYRKNNYQSQIEQAAVFWYLANVGFGGTIHGGFGRRRNSTSHPATIKNRVNNILSFRDRLRDVYLENCDFQKVIKRYDSKDTLFYVDPPYVSMEHYYKINFGIEDHERLSQILNAVLGKVVLSYYPHELLDKLYVDWHRTEIPSFKSSYYVKDMKKRPRSTELVLTNYEQKHKQLDLDI
ncbi:MAG: DNA adenine methylase, partial [Patescibacteria group bacterium]